MDIQRLDTSAVGNCHPVYDLPSTFTLQLFDLHTLATDPPTPIEAHTIDGPASPGGTAYPWTSVHFDIPSGASDVPPGWVLNVPPDMTYTWSDLMHNLDGISFYPIDPGEITFDSCWQLGADNVVVRYGDGDTIFADGFDGAPADGRAWSDTFCIKRAIRGGAWNNLPIFVRSGARVGASQSGADQDYDYSTLTGFRIARDLP